MTEIKIKKKAPVWPWVVLIIVILGLLYYLFTNNKTEPTRTEEIKTVTTIDDDENMDDSYALSTGAATKVEDYTDFLAKDEKLGVDTEYSNHALTKLIDATEAVGNSVNVDISTELDGARADAAAILKEPKMSNHTEKIKSAATIVAQALTKIQSQKFTDLSMKMNEVNTSLNNIDSKVDTTHQKELLKQFFQKAGELLTNMKNE